VPEPFTLGMFLGNRPYLGIFDKMKKTHRNILKIQTENYL